MDKYRLTFGVEPTDKYKKAQYDLIQALHSLRELSLQEQRILAEEVFGAVNVAFAIELFQKSIRS